MDLYEKAEEFSGLQGDVSVRYAFEQGAEWGQLSCAASPWTYRTDTGDRHGKVVESAELPEKPREDYLFLFSFPASCTRVVVGTFTPSFAHAPWIMDGGKTFTEEEFRKHLIAYAEIQEVE